MDPNSRKKTTYIIITVAIIIIIIIIIMLRQSKGPAVTNGVPVEALPQATEDAFHTDLNKVDFAAPVSTASSGAITPQEKKAVYESLLSGYKTMTSKDAKAIRAYMTAKANTPAEKNLLTKMTDADLVSLSSRLAQTMIMPTPGLLLTPSTVWNRSGNVITIQYSDPNTGTTTKAVMFINGQWY